MSAYTTRIPTAVFERLPMVMKNHQNGDPFDVRIQAFPGDDGESMFSIDVYTNAVTVDPNDRRQRSYVEAKRTSYFFNEDGGFDGEPQVTTTRYQG
jgi:hypothetical protein